jgi:hypothetical protein
MSGLVVLPALFLALAAAHLILVPRAIRRMRAVKEGGPEFHRRWRELEPARRRAITRAIRRGRAVSDPRETELALEAIRNGERVFAAIRPLQLLYAPALVVLVAWGFAEHARFVVVGAAALAGLFALTSLSQWRRARKLRAAAAAMKAGS